MTTPTKVLSGSAWLATVAIAAATGLAIPQAQAQIFPPDYGLFDNGDPHNLVFTNSNVTGNIGIADTGGFVGSGTGTITGTVQFAAANMGQFNPDGITVTGGAIFNDANVQTDFNAFITLSQTLSTMDGTAIGIAATGNLFLSGANSVFTATIDPSFVAGTTFTIHGTSSQTVAFNIPDTMGQPFDGSIVLMGGITSDHVLFNFDAGNFDTFSGGDPLLIENDGSGTTGTYLDPNGAITINGSVIDGRVFGGDTADFGVTDSTIVSPPPVSPVSPISEPTSLALLGAGLVALGFIRRRRPPLARS
jgi:hypothetical protein